MSRHAKIMSCHAKIVQNESGDKNRVKAILPDHTCTYGWGARPSKKNWTRKKRLASWARQRQQITEAADGGARARTGADGAVALNLLRGPGAYAQLSRADGQLTRAGQHYYSHLGLRPPTHPRAQRRHPAGQKKLVRSLQGGEHRLTKLGKGFFRDRSSSGASGAAGGTPARALSAGTGCR